MQKSEFLAGRAFAESEIARALDTPEYANDPAGWLEVVLADVLGQPDAARYGAIQYIAERIAGHPVAEAA